MKRSWSALVGIVAGALTLGVATLLAGLMTRTGLATGTPSPVVAVGGVFVDHTPPWLKNFAVSTFGTHDKLALFVGMAVVLTAFCAVIGVLGAQRHTAGLVAFVVVGAVGALAVASRPHSGSLDILPTVIGIAAGLWALSALWQQGAKGSRRHQHRPTSFPRGRSRRRRCCRHGRRDRSVAGTARHPGG